MAPSGYLHNRLFLEEGKLRDSTCICNDQFRQNSSALQYFSQKSTEINSAENLIIIFFLWLSTVFPLCTYYFFHGRNSGWFSQEKNHHNIKTFGRVRTYRIWHVCISRRHWWTVKYCWGSVSIIGIMNKIEKLERPEIKSGMTRSFFVIDI